MSFVAPPTMVSGWPTRAIAEADLSHLKTIIYGGAPMYLADLETARCSVLAWPRSTGRARRR